MATAQWNSERTQFLTAMIEEKRGGVFTSSGFKSSSWTAICNRFNRVANVTYTKQQLQSQYNLLKKKYAIFEQLRNNSGFGWDATTNMVTAPESVWESYCAVHKGLHLTFIAADN